MLETRSFSEKTLPLSPIDSLFVGSGSYPIEFAFFYHRPFAISNMAESLNKAWNQVADGCPLLKSRLKIQGERYNFVWDEFLSKPEPIKFVIADMVIHPDRHPNPYDLIDPVTTKPGEPLAKLKITEGSDGVILGFSLSHAIADGFTYFMILAAIARLANPATASEPMIPMNHERGRVFEIAHRAKQSVILGLSQSELRNDIDRSSIRYWKKHYDGDRIRNLYQKFSDAPKRLSTNDMICAELWREFIVEFDQSAEQSISLVSPVDYRRVYPDFPKNYAGNAVALSRLNLTREDIIKMPAVDLAIKIRLMVQEVDQDYIEMTSAGLTSKLRGDDWAGLGEYHIADPNSGLLITNLSRLSLSSLDFGVGAPTYCRPLTPCRRTIVLLSDGHEGIIAHIHG